MKAPRWAWLLAALVFLSGAAEAVTYSSASVPFSWIDASTHTKLGPTTGGVLLAYEVARQLGVRGIFCETDEHGGRSFQRGFKLKPRGKVLVVDDIVTTGGSLVDTIDAVIKAGGEPVCVSAIADRTGGKVTFGDVPFVPATEVVMESFPPDDCPLCKQGVPLKVT